jgi:hypothetical protein
MCNNLYAFQTVSAEHAKLVTTKYSGKNWAKNALEEYTRVEK